MVKRFLRMIAIAAVLSLFSAFYILKKDWELLIVGKTLGPFSDLNPNDPSFYWYCAVKLSKYLVYDFCAWALLLLILPDLRTLRLGAQIMLIRLFVLVPVYWYSKSIFEAELTFISSFLHTISFNPILIMGLIPALWIEHKSSKV